MKRESTAYCLFSYVKMYCYKVGFDTPYLLNVIGVYWIYAALLRRSCEEYFLSGNRTSGVHRVDLDGNGPIKPLHVYCQLGAIVDGRKYGMTQVEHNLRPQTKFRGNLKDMRKRNSVSVSSI